MPDRFPPTRVGGVAVGHHPAWILPGAVLVVRDLTQRGDRIHASSVPAIGDTNLCNDPLSSGDSVAQREGELGLLDDLIVIGDGVRSGIQDVPSLVVNILSGDVHGAVTDGRNVIGDVTGVASGLQNLGVSLGEVPRRYLGEAAKLADSKILSGAQLAIEAEKALTGSGDPDVGNGYRESADRLEEAVGTLIDARPAEDRWDGAAAEAYAAANNEHRSRTSAVQVADSEIARILATEAGQVIRTRETLDDASQNLYDFGLATSWMNFVPGLAAAKAAADVAAAAAAMVTTNTAMAILVKNSAENAARIWKAKEAYSEATIAMAQEDRMLAKDPELSGPCGLLLKQEDDLARRPRRIADADTYVVPDTDPEWGPPATPYSAVQIGPTGATPTPASTPSTHVAPRSPSTHRMPGPATPTPPEPSGQAGATTSSTERAPVETEPRKPERQVESR